MPVMGTSSHEATSWERVWGIPLLHGLLEGWDGVGVALKQGIWCISEWKYWVSLCKWKYCVSLCKSYPNTRAFLETTEDMQSSWECSSVAYVNYKLKLIGILVTLIPLITAH